MFFLSVYQLTNSTPGYNSDRYTFDMLFELTLDILWIIFLKFHIILNSDQPPRSQSIVVVIWSLLVRIVSGRSPRLYAYQNSLPRMNVPPLKSTVQKLLTSVKPILDEVHYKKMEEDANVS